MNSNALRNIGILAAHDIRVAARTPVMLVMLAACVLLMLVFSSIAGGPDLTSDAFLMTTVIAVSPAFTGSICSLYTMSEEIERGVTATLVQSGMTTRQIAAGKFLCSYVWTLITVVLCGLTLGFSLEQLSVTLALSIPASLPILLVSLGCGLLASDQMKSSIYSLPIVVLAIVPLLGLISNSLRHVACFLPMGFAAEAACLVTGAPATLSPAVIAVLCLLWIAVSAAFVVWAHRRYKERIIRAIERQ